MLVGGWWEGDRRSHQSVEQGSLFDFEDGKEAKKIATGSLSMFRTENENPNLPQVMFVHFDHNVLITNTTHVYGLHDESGEEHIALVNRNKNSRAVSGRPCVSVVHFLVFTTNYHLMGDERLFSHEQFAKPHRVGGQGSEKEDK